MQNGQYDGPARKYLCAVLSCLLLSPGATVGARADDHFAGTTFSAVGAALVARPGLSAASSTAGPVRMVRFSLVQGGVSWRATSRTEWSNASNNLPLEQNTQVYTPASSRAELTFDDGSILRLGDGATATLTSLYSDADGEFTEIKLNDGHAWLRLTNKYSIFQIDTPYASVKAVGPATVCIGVSNTVAIEVNHGDAMVECPKGKTTLATGQYIAFRDASSPMVISAPPAEDAWDRWNIERDRVDARDYAETRRHLSSNMCIASPNLDEYGHWGTAPGYGSAWYPNVSHGWRPYSAGRWVWVNPYGWTWVSDEPWGWAPYHYGTWDCTADGWCWVPGPEYQYWSPGVVDFCTYRGCVCWAPLCPWEVTYPGVFGFGCWGGGWCGVFSVGLCGCYYPGFNSCWRTFGGYGLAGGFGFNVGLGYNYGGFGVGGFGNGRFRFGGGPGGAGFGRNFFAANRNTFGSRAFTPASARFGGASILSARGFAAGSRSAGIPRGNLTAFSRGRTVGAPRAGDPPAGGPSSVRPTLASTTPSRSFTHNSPSSGIANRSMYRAPVASSVRGNMPSFRSGASARAATGTAASARRMTTSLGANRGAAASNGGRSAIGGASLRSRAASSARPAGGVPTNVRSARSSLGVGSRASAAASHAGAFGSRSAALAAGRAGVGATQNAVIRARQSLGLPGRARAANGRMVGPDAGSFHGGIARNFTAYSTGRRATGGAGGSRLSAGSNRAGRSYSSAGGSYGRSSGGGNFGRSSGRSYSSAGGSYGRSTGGGNFGRSFGRSYSSAGGSYGRSSSGGSFHGFSGGGRSFGRAFSGGGGSFGRSSSSAGGSFGRSGGGSFHGGGRRR